MLILIITNPMNMTGTNNISLPEKT